jgi:repressor LexA
MLTERQQAVLDFIRTHQTTKGVPPSSREIQRHFGFASQNAAVCHLRALAHKGLVTQLADWSWGLRAREVQAHLFEVPVYGSIPAGLPAMQEQQPVERIGIDPTLFGLRRWKPLHVWALRVQGDSMIGAHILDGDLAVLERREPRPGDIIAALVDSTESTLKRLVHVRGKPVLRAENKRYGDIVPEQRLECQGVLVGVIRRSAA